MRRAPLIASLLSSAIAWADEPVPEDPRDVFGMKKKPVATCDSGRTLGCATALDDFDPSSPNLLRTWLAADYLLALPVSDSRQFDVAHFASGAARDEAGPVFGGATGLENTWTIEGAPAENLRTGNAETRVPLTFMSGMMVSAGGFAARDRVGLGGTIDVELLRGGDKHEVSAYAWAGFTESARERPIAAATFQLRRASVQPGPETSVSTVAHGPIGSFKGGRTWYAAGVAASIGSNEVNWRAGRLVDADANSIPDGLPGIVELEPIGENSKTAVDYLIPILARAGWTRGPHDVTLTFLGNASRDGVFLQNATEQAAGIERRAFIGDGIATYKGTWRDTRARVMFAWHRSVRTEDAYDNAAAGIPQFLSAYVPATLAEEPALATACSDAAGDPIPTVPNCPIPFGFFASAGAGLLVDSVGDRPTVSADVTRRFGRHIVRAGGWFEDTRLVNTSRFTGGELQRSLFDTHLDRQRFFSTCEEAPESPCAYLDEARIAYRTRYTAAYVEDTFSPAPNIRVDTGLRWELMWVGPRLHFSNQLAPRLGLAWDILGNGQSRWWATMGRTHTLLPAGLGPTVIGREKSVRDVELGVNIRDRNIDTGNVFDIGANIEPARQDEAAAGFEIGVIKAMRAGVWIQRRELRRGLETMLTNSITLEQQFDNPGREGPLTEPASRDSTVIAFDIRIAPSPVLGVRATYLWGRTVGSWIGPFDPRQGTTLYDGVDWDLDATNLVGRLPTDQGHRFVLETDHRGTVRSIPYSIATRLAVTSGKPRSVLGDGDLGVVQLVPRGSAARNPVLTQANVRLATRIRGIDITLDVFNAFDRREATQVNEFYADSVLPISGGTVEDLVFLKTQSCDELRCASGTAQRRTAFGLPTVFQTPRSVILGAHHRF